MLKRLADNLCMNTDRVAPLKQASGAQQHLQNLVGRAILVPADKIDLADSEEALQGTVICLSKEESNCLYCTFPGSAKWYCWHVDELRPWLVQPKEKDTEQRMEVPSRKAVKQPRKGHHRSQSGRTQRANMSVKAARSRPQAPGPEHLWKYCKRCNSWKHRPGDFSKNNRTPDGLQFYCRFCHNRMTKFNQARRLEDQHVAQKQLQLAKSPERPACKPLTSRQSPKSGTSVAASLKERQAGFDVIGSKVPRQQRTYATYKKGYLAESLSDELPARHQNSLQPPSLVSSIDRSTSDRPVRSHPFVASTQPGNVRKALPKPLLRPKTSPVELMLQANLVLEQLERVQNRAGSEQQAEDNGQPSPAASPSISPEPALAHGSAPAYGARSKQQSDTALGRQITHSRRHQHNGMPSVQEPASSSTSVQNGILSSPAAGTGSVDQLHSPSHPSLAVQARTSPFALPALQAQAAAPKLSDTAMAAEGNGPAKRQGRSGPELAGRASAGAAPAAVERQFSAQRHGSPIGGQQRSGVPSGVTGWWLQDEGAKAGSPGGSPKASGKCARADSGRHSGSSRLPFKQTSNSQLGSRMASPDQSEGNSRKKRKYSTSPTRLSNSHDSLRMDSLAAAAAAASADAAHVQKHANAGQHTDQAAAQPDANTNARREVSTGKAAAAAVPEPDTGKPTAGTPPVKAAAAVATSNSAVRNQTKQSDSMSTLACLMKDMPPEQLQEVLQGLLQSGTSAVPLEVLEQMRKQLSQAMAPDSLAQQNPQQGKRRPAADPFSQAACVAPLTSTSSAQLPPASLSPSARKPTAIRPRGNAPQAALSQPGCARNAVFSSLLPPGNPAFGRNNLSMPALPSATATAPLATFKPSSLPSGSAANPAAFSWLQQRGLQGGHAAVPTGALGLAGSVPAYKADHAVAAGTTAMINAPRPVAAAPGHLAGAGPGSKAVPVSALGPHLGGASALGSVNALGSAGALAAGPAHAALELSLLLTTLQSLAVTPNGAEPGSAPQSTLSTNCHAAMLQLRDWLSQLQHQAVPLPEPSPAQQAQEDADLAAQVRSQMWGNLQGILNMLRGQGCSPHVHDMVHQIAVHFANEQSQSVAVDKRLRSNLVREKEARRRTQQQLSGGIQVLTALQRVLGSVKMQQQQQQQQQQLERLKSVAGAQQRPEAGGPRESSVQRVADAEREQRIAQHQEWQRKEQAYQAELSLAQTNNAKLHEQVSSLMEAAKSQADQQHGAHSQELQGMQVKNQSLTDDLTGCKKERDRLHEQLAGSSSVNRRLADENGRLLAQLKALQGNVGV